MKNKTQALSGALLFATLLMGFAPAHAASTPTSSIGTYAKKHVSTLGKALAPEETYANGALSQRFQNGLLTWSKRTGVQLLTNPAEIDAFLKAGGASTFGALESGSWRNSFCSQTVTTFDGKTRWLIVVDSKTQPSTSIDLNSAEGKTWKSERSKTGKCFTPTQVAEEPSQPANPQINLDWSKATYIKNQSALLLQTDTTAYVTKADSNGTRIADSAVYEVEWLKTNT